MRSMPGSVPGTVCARPQAIISLLLRLGTIINGDRGLVSKKEQESSSPKSKLFRDFIWATRGGKTKVGEKSQECEPS